MWHCMRVSFWLPSLAWTSTVSSGFKSLLQSWPMAWSKQISWVWATCIGIAGIIHYCNVRQHEHRHAFWMVFYCLALLRANHPFVNTHITTYSLSPVPWTSKALLSSHWNKETIFIARAIIQIRCFCLFLFIIYLYFIYSFKKKADTAKTRKTYPQTSCKSHFDAANVDNSSSELLKLLPAHLVQEIPGQRSIYAAIGVRMLLAEFMRASGWSLPLLAHDMPRISGSRPMWQYTKNTQVAVATYIKRNPLEPSARQKGSLWKSAERKKFSLFPGCSGDHFDTKNPMRTGLHLTLNTWSDLQEIDAADKVLELQEHPQSLYNFWLQYQLQNGPKIAKELTYNKANRCHAIPTMTTTSWLLTRQTARLWSVPPMWMGAKLK